jgi:hypothetical protein
MNAGFPLMCALGHSRRALQGLKMPGLKMPELGAYNCGRGVVDDVAAIGTDFERDRHGPSAEWLQQMRPDLGRLAAEILQVGPFVARRGMLGAANGDGILPEEDTGSIP